MNENHLLQIYHQRQNNAIDETAYDTLQKQLHPLLKLDVHTLQLCIQAFLCAQNDEQYLQQIINISHILIQSQDPAISNKNLHLDTIESFYLDCINKCKQLNQETHNIVSNKQVSQAFLSNYNNAWKQQTEIYYDIFNELLEIYEEIDFIIYNETYTDIPSQYRNLHEYTLHFFSYVCACLDELENALHLYEKIMSNTPKITMDQFLYENNIISLYNLKEQSNQTIYEDYQCSDLANLALSIVEKRMHQQQYNQETLDLLEKILILGFGETMIVKALTYISIIIHSLNELDDENFELSQIPSQLAQLILQKDSDTLASLQAIVTTILNHYIDYESSLKEDRISQILDSFAIEYDDCIEYVMEISEWYYEECDMQLYV